MDLSNWTMIADNYRFRTSSNGNDFCPISGQNCWQICGQSSSSTSAYMYRMASTKGYQQIELTYSIIGYNHQYSSDYCEIYYTVNNVTNYWQLIGSYQWDQWDPAYLNQVFSFNGTGDDNEGVGIFIYAHTQSSSRCCRVRDFKLTGIPMTTTINPTQQILPQSPTGFVL